MYSGKESTKDLYQITELEQPVGENLEEMTDLELAEILEPTRRVAPNRERFSKQKARLKIHQHNKERHSNNLAKQQKIKGIRSRSYNRAAEYYY